MVNITRMEINHHLFPKGHVKLLLNWFDENNIIWVWNINDKLFLPGHETILISIKYRIQAWWSEKFNIELSDGIFSYG